MKLSNLKVTSSKFLCAACGFSVFVLSGCGGPSTHSESSSSSSTSSSTSSSSSSSSSSGEPATSVSTWSILKGESDLCVGSQASFDRTLNQIDMENMAGSTLYLKSAMSVHSNVKQFFVDDSICKRYRW